MKYNYTLDENRILFSNYLYKIDIDKLMTIMTKMKWDNYIFDDVCTLINSIDQSYTSCHITAKTYNDDLNKPYYFLGGCVYYLHTKTKPDDKHYMDPTSDIDIHLNIPKITSINGDNNLITLSSYYKSVFKKNGEINELITHYLNWILDNIFIIFQKITKESDYNDLEPYNKDVYSRHIHKKIYFTIVKENKMIKIQIECKVKGMTKPDHLLECVLIADKLFDTLDMNNRKFNNSITLYNGFYIQKYKYMILDNIDSITNRYILKDDPNYKHKFFNHIARLRYLNYIYEKTTFDADQNILELLYFLYKENNIKKYNYSKIHDTEFLLSMIDKFLINLKNTDIKAIIVKNKFGRNIIVNTKDILKPYYELKNRGRSIWNIRNTRKNINNFKHKTKKNITNTDISVKSPKSITNKSVTNKLGNN